MKIYSFGNDGKFKKEFELTDELCNRLALHNEMLSVAEVRKVLSTGGRIWTSFGGYYQNHTKPL